MVVKIDIDQYKNDIESSWIWKIGLFFNDHWLSIIIAIVSLIIMKTIFNNIIFPYYYENFKKWYGLENTLSHMKNVLEADYNELWHENEFCLAFLALQSEHQNLVRIAKSDENGENPRRFHWANRYSKIELK